MSTPESLPAADDEWLSRFIDQDTDRRETAVVLERLTADAAWRARWARYHLIRDALRGELVVVPPTAWTTRVSAHLATASRGQVLRRPWRLLAGAALAVAVFMSVILPASLTPAGYLGRWSQRHFAGGALSACEHAPVMASSGASFAHTALSAADCASLRRKLNRLIVEHRESAITVTGFMPYVTLLVDDPAR